MSHTSSISSRSRTAPHIRRSSYNAVFLTPITGNGHLDASSKASSSSSPAKPDAPESPARPRQDVASFMKGSSSTISTGDSVKKPFPTFIVNQRRAASIHTCTLPAAPNSAKRTLILSVEPDLFRLMDENNREVACYSYEHLSGVQVDGSGLALIIYKPEIPAYAYFFNSESTAPIAAALELRRHKRSSSEKVEIKAQVMLRFANDSMKGKRVADLVSLPSGGPLTFTENDTAVETVPVKGLAILRTQTSLEVFLHQRHTLWSIITSSSEDLSQLFSALLQMQDPPVVTALPEQVPTPVDTLLALHASFLKTLTPSQTVSTRTVVPLVDSSLPRPASVVSAKPSRLEARAQSFSPPRVKRMSDYHVVGLGGGVGGEEGGDGSRGEGEGKRANRAALLTEIVPQSNSPLRKPTKKLLRLLAPHHGFTFIDAIFKTFSPASAEAERVAKGVVVVQSALGKGGEFAAHIARREIASLAPNDYASLFRANTMGSKALILFCRRQGMEFFHTALRPALAQFLDFPKPVEIDPSRDAKLNVQKNAANLRALVQQFLEGLLGATDQMPTSLSIVMATIREEVEKRFPTKGPHAVGCLLFLRLVCPLIIAPEQFGLASVNKITAASRRGLILVSKVIQAMLSELATQVKEPYMSPLDSWIGERRAVVYSYGVALSRLPETRRLQGRCAVAEATPSREELLGSFLGLQTALQMNEAMIVNELTSSPKDASRFSRAMKGYAAAHGK